MDGRPIQRPTGPDQALDADRPVDPSRAVQAGAEAERALLPVWLPPALAAAPTPAADPDKDAVDDGEKSIMGPVRQPAQAGRWVGRSSWTRSCRHR